MCFRDYVIVNRQRVLIQSRLIFKFKLNKFFLQEIKFNLSNRFIEQQEFGTTMLDFFSNFMSTRIREKKEEEEKSFDF
jgi:hypothetical protein